jgi:quercetin dioxygenase-like cupin family protein
MPYEIFKNIPHQRVIGGQNMNDEIFDLYQCGIFHHQSAIENIEFVELQPNALYRPHYHKKSSAVIYIIYGLGRFQLGSRLLDYKPGMRIDIPAGITHGFRTDTSTLFLSIQSPPIINTETNEIDLHYANGAGQDARS